MPQTVERAYTLDIVGHWTTPALCTPLNARLRLLEQQEPSPLCPHNALLEF